MSDRRPFSQTMCPDSLIYHANRIGYIVGNCARLPDHSSIVQYSRFYPWIMLKDCRAVAAMLMGVSMTVTLRCSIEIQVSCLSTKYSFTQIHSRTFSTTGLRFNTCCTSNHPWRCIYSIARRRAPSLFRVAYPGTTPHGRL